MDELAVKLGMDPLDLRLANHAEAEPMEGKPWSSKKLRECYAEAAEVYGWRSRHQRPREDGPFLIGHGMATASMFCARFQGAARVRVRGDGNVVVETSANDIATGSQTVCALVAADALGVPVERVSVRWGDTDLPTAGPVYWTSPLVVEGRDQNVMRPGAW